MFQCPRKRIRSVSCTDHEPLELPDLVEFTNNHDLTDTTAASKFVSIVSDDLLLEIILRLPRARDVVRCGAVCKRWSSLANLSGKDRRFIRNYVQYHQPEQRHRVFYRYTRTTFQFQERSFPEKTLFDQPFVPSSSSSLPPAGVCDLSFLPGWPRVMIRASFEDLLLVSHGWSNHYVCNLMTRQWLSLPEASFYDCDTNRNRLRLVGTYGFGLVREPEKQFECRRRDRYRVVLISDSRFDFDGSYNFKANIFSSESGQWKFSFFSVPRVIVYEQTPESLKLFVGVKLEVGVTTKGVLYWLEGSDLEKIEAMFAFDPFNLTCRCIRLPVCSAFGSHVPRPFLDKVRLGVVQGRLRLSLLLPENESAGHNLKVWEFNDDGEDSWLLVNDVVLKRETAIMSFVLAFHPSNGDVIFVVCDQEIYQYEMGKDKCQKIGEFSRRESLNEIKKRLARDLHVYTLKTLPWPTPIFTFPSASDT